MAWFVDAVLQKTMGKILYFDMGKDSILSGHIL